MKTWTSEDLKSKIIEWNSLDAKIFEKSNETFWEKYKSIPNLSTLENEFGIETGSSNFNIFFQVEFSILERLRTSVWLMKNANAKKMIQNALINHLVFI